LVEQELESSVTLLTEDNVRRGTVASGRLGA
jgi:hypothetical protein